MAADAKDTVWVYVIRKWPWGGRTRSVGSTLEVPRKSADRAAAAKPPFVRVFEHKDVASATDPWYGFTDGAREALEATGVAPGLYAGERREADGKVLKSHVTDWLNSGAVSGDAGE